MNKYQLTPKILTNLAKIERCYGQLEALHLPQQFQLNLERDNLIQSSYVSNSIEGNPLSLPEVTNLLLGTRLPVNRDEQEVKNYFEILKSLEQFKTAPLTIDTILTIHRQLLTKVDDEIAGVFRNKRVVIGKQMIKNNQITIKVKHEPPFHTRSSITTAIKQLLIWLKNADILPVLKISLFHHYYVYLHPFIDGNGRTVRLLTALLFWQNNYAINKYFVLDDYYDLDRQGYSDALHSADKGNSTKWLEYFTDGIYYSLDSALAKAQNSLSTLKVSDRPTAREQEVLAFFARPDTQITTSNIAAWLKISRQQAQGLLANLITKGLIKKFGSTKSSYYQLTPSNARP
jgi:Fic family protein